MQSTDNRLVKKRDEELYLNAEFEWVVKNEAEVLPKMEAMMRRSYCRDCLGEAANVTFTDGTIES